MPSLQLSRGLYPAGKCGDIYSDCGSNFVGAKHLSLKSIKSNRYGNFRTTIHANECTVVLPIDTAADCSIRLSPYSFLSVTLQRGSGKKWKSHAYAEIGRSPRDVGGHVTIPYPYCPSAQAYTDGDCKGVRRHGSSETRKTEPRRRWARGAKQATKPCTRGHQGHILALETQLKKLCKLRSVGRLDSKGPSDTLHRGGAEGKKKSFAACSPPPTPYHLAYRLKHCAMRDEAHSKLKRLLNEAERQRRRREAHEDGAREPPVQDPAAAQGPRGHGGPQVLQQVQDFEELSTLGFTLTPQDDLTDSIDCHGPRSLTDNGQWSSNVTPHLRFDVQR
ncbi:hypothetical protein CEXT_536701 [Caerostris extrusa]|uniref:Uncharacterized protein n=1 Tax=Caerostris extrusa TaxID=172846 RepID=A0AAV4Q630_CAEEX|nr:hypothetical protein CEXT_536701 [Caerostris extrusa]